MYKRHAWPALIAMAVQSAPAAAFSFTSDVASLALPFETAKLTWDAGASPCVASGAWSGNSPGIGRQSVQPVGTGKQTYTLNCGGVAQSVVLNVSEAPLDTDFVVLIDRDPIAPAESFVKTWHAPYADNCDVEGEGEGLGAFGIAEGYIAAGIMATEEVLTVTCTRGTNSLTKTFTSHFDPIAVSSHPGTPLTRIYLGLVTDRGTVRVGDPVTVKWDTPNMLGPCTASGAWSGDKEAAGSESIVLGIEGEASFDLSCNAGQYTQSAKVEVLPRVPALTLTASKAAPAVGETITLAWNSSGVPGCTASGDWGGNKALSGTFATTIDASATYTLSCTNEAGTASRTLVLTPEGTPAGDGARSGNSGGPMPLLAMLGAGLIALLRCQWLLRNARV